MEEIDVYCFGHLLYEMAMGRPLNSETCDSLPASWAPDLRKRMFHFLIYWTVKIFFTTILNLSVFTGSILEAILSTEASKTGLPAVSDLLQHQ